MDKRRITARGIIVKDNKILAQQLTPDHHGKARDYWCTPGGALDDNEAIVDGLKREMIEETGIMPEIGRLLFVQQYFDGENEQIEFFFHIKNANDYQSIDLTKTSHGTQEIKNVGFVDPKNTWLLPTFLTSVDLVDYTENNRDVLFVNNL